MTEGKVLWRWNGPPLIEISCEVVTHASRRQEQVVITTQGGLPGVVIIAQSKGRVGLVQQLRAAVGQPLWELPRGFGEAGDDPAGEDAQGRACRDADRELREEIGCHLETARYLGTFFPDSGLQANGVAVVHGTVGRSDPAINCDEIGLVRWIDIAAIPDLIVRGTLRDGITLSALALWHASSLREEGRPRL
jgi:8-oxo-dGTP pyrophosphatase MutT (NUDIX family)